MENKIKTQVLALDEKITVAELTELGFVAAAEELDKKLEFKRKMMIAYEHFRVVTPKHINKFNQDLRRRTMERTGKEKVDLTLKYDALVFKELSGLKQLPPASVLKQMKAAKDKNCFDKFVIAKIEAVVEYKDPIVFGLINGCDDYFFVGQWDNDVKISDLISASEG